MNEENILQKIDTLEKEIAELKNAPKKRNFSNLLQKTFHKSHFVIGIIITLVATSLIVYGTQINFTDGTVISASEVNSNFTELYNKVSEPSFVHRGDPAVFDYNNLGLTADGGFYDLDLSLIVPEGAQAVVLLCGMRGTAGQIILFRKNGNTNLAVSSLLAAPVDNQDIWGDMVVALDSNRVIEYSIQSGVSYYIVVKGWIM